MFLDLYLTATLHLIGVVLLGHFEAHTPLKKRLFKIAILQAIAAGLHLLIGHWGLLVVLGLLAFSIGFHVWWTRKHGIHPLTAEPRERYYRLRGWPAAGRS